MIIIALFFVVLIPKSIKTWGYLFFWIIALIIIVFPNSFQNILRLLYLEGLLRLELATETILFLAILFILFLFITNLNTQVAQLRKGILSLLFRKETISTKVSIIMPAYNEAENLEDLVPDLLKKAPQHYEFVLVDDGSIDNTSEICENFANTYESVRFIRHPENRGKTKAFETGVYNSDGDIVVLLETDWQYEPNDIEFLVTPIEKGYDIVNGWRISRADKSYRIVMSKTYNFLQRKMLNTSFRDHNSGFKAFKRETIESMFKLLPSLDLIGPHRFLLALANFNDYKITEAPIHHYPRKKGKSYIRISKTPLHVIHDILKLRLFLSYKRSKLNLD
jgi:glycosyltransferase involved in cell wall biosynthesis